MVEVTCPGSHSSQDQSQDSHLDLTQTPSEPDSTLLCSPPRKIMLGIPTACEASYAS